MLSSSLLPPCHHQTLPGHPSQKHGGMSSTPPHLLLQSLRQGHGHVEVWLLAGTGWSAAHLGAQQCVKEIQERKL